jgi:glutaminase
VSERLSNDAKTPIGSRPPAQGFDAAVSHAYETYRSLAEGKNFADLSALANAPTEHFGIALQPTVGRMSAAGDSEQAFPIMSISKVCTLALVIQESGEQAIEEGVGVDSTGGAYNAIAAVEAHRGRNLNPFVTAGAIATTGSVKGADPDEMWKKILDIHTAFAGRQLTVNEEVYKASIAIDHRNRAIGMLMSSYGRFPGDPIQVTNLFSRQCSISANAKDLGIMAATLANGGRNPVTGRQVIDARHVPGILAIMATAGLYQTSGRWLFHTGLPAKSGIGGGMIAVAPGKFGIGTYSPPLDVAGNSVRGQKAIAAMSDILAANPYGAAAV